MLSPVTGSAHGPWPMAHGLLPWNNGREDSSGRAFTLRGSNRDARFRQMDAYCMWQKYCGLRQMPLLQRENRGCEPVSL